MNSHRSYSINDTIVKAGPVSGVLEPQLGLPPVAGCWWSRWLGEAATHLGSSHEENQSSHEGIQMQHIVMNVSGNCHPILGMFQCVNILLRGS